MKELILCACKKGNKISEQRISQWQEELDKKQIAYTLIEDLCGLAAKGKIELQDISKGNEAIVVGCQPKAMKNLLERAGISTKNEDFQFRHAEETSFELIDNENFDKGESKTISYDLEWKPWYPVLDYDLCTSCQKCMNFCLFGVYTLSDEGAVVVENPENCKDLCPACARTCPSQAIVFPKHHESPIDGGKGEIKDISTESLLTQIQKNQDVYQLLANRRKSSGITLMKDQLSIAKKEREVFKNKSNGEEKEED